MSVSRTARYVALFRALETAETGRAPLFEDPFAAAFLTPALRLAVRASRVPPVRRLVERYIDRRAPGGRTSGIARTAFIDEVVRARARAGVPQVVLLGAGFDCRAHRLPELAGARVFEVDRAAMQEAKRALLASAAASGSVRARVRDDVRYVAVDFLRDVLEERLKEAGWDPALATMVVWEGVTSYLDEPSVIGVLSWIGRCAPGSAVVFTFIHGGLLDGSARFEGGEAAMSSVRRMGEPWTFGIRPEEAAAFVARCGLVLREELGADAYRKRYLGPEAGGRGYVFYRIAVAETGGR